MERYLTEKMEAREQDVTMTKLMMLIYFKIIHEYHSLRRVGEEPTVAFERAISTLCC